MTRWLKAIGLPHEAGLVDVFVFDTFHLTQKGAEREFVPERLRGEMARFDVVGKDGKVVVAKDKRITQRHVRELVDSGAQRIAVPTDYIVVRSLATNVVDKSTGELLAKANDGITADMLTKDADLVGIFADNAQMGTGAGASISEKKLGGKLCLVAFDADKGEVEHLNDGSIYALILQDPFMMGYAGVFNGYAASKGVRLPKNVDTGVGAVTKANMADPKYAGLMDPSKYKTAPFTGN